MERGAPNVLKGCWALLAVTLSVLALESLQLVDSRLPLRRNIGSDALSAERQRETIAFLQHPTRSGKKKGGGSRSARPPASHGGETRHRRGGKKSLLEVSPLRSIQAHTSSGSTSYTETTTVSEAKIDRETYMKRYNIPANHVQMMFEKGIGGKVTKRSGKDFKVKSGTTQVGIYTQYAPMEDRSVDRWCVLPETKVDTEDVLGQKLMTVGSCPVHGKYIAFTEKDGTPIKDSLTRWRNQIRGGVYPSKATETCPKGADDKSYLPGQAEVPKEIEGYAMYSHASSKCPFGQEVQDEMNSDPEYESNECFFCNINHPILSIAGKNLDGTPAVYSFHGMGEALGMDYHGTALKGDEMLSSFGCPPYKVPQPTPRMYDPSFITDEFTCSQLSRCTTHCWVAQKGTVDAPKPCFRSLPAIYNSETRECVINGWQTQYNQKQDCAASSTDDDRKRYCVKPWKTAASSRLSYVSAMIDPAFEEKCPPREPEANAKFGKLSADGKSCKPLELVRDGHTDRDVTFEKCGQLVFEGSKSDDAGAGSVSSKLNWAHWTPSKACKDAKQTDCHSGKGTCTRFDTVPDCLASAPGTIAVTALSGIDPAMAKDAPSGVVFTEGGSSDTSCTLDCGKYGTCDNSGDRPRCECDYGWTGEFCDEKASGCGPGGNCSGNGTCSGGKCTSCKAGWTGVHCEVNFCDHFECVNGTCDNRNGTAFCECNDGWSGKHCDQAESTEHGCGPDKNCTGNGTCSGEKCKCYMGWIGDYCQTATCENFVCEEHGTCKIGDSGAYCECEAGWEGPHCGQSQEHSCGEDKRCSGNGYCSGNPGACKCDMGWGGTYCEIPTCDNYKCSEHGTCILPDGGEAHCQCDKGWKGKYCAVPMSGGGGAGDGGAGDGGAGDGGAGGGGEEDPCGPNGDCGEHGDCMDENGRDRHCQCYAGWIGDLCDENMCKGWDCGPHGYCDSTSGKAKCVCNAQWTGEYCDVDKCDSIECGQNQLCTIRNMQPVCTCTLGWTGDDCLTNLCDGVDCGSGWCDSTTGKVICMCNPGWSGPTCEDNVCAGMNCGNGDCNSDVRPPECRCYAGWLPPDCMTNMCDTHDCEPGQRCDATSGSPVCR